MKRIAVLIILSLLTFFLLAQDSFDDYLKQQNQVFNQYAEEQKKAEANFYKQQDSLFIQYKEEIKKLWGEFRESSPKEWVSYNSDFTGRSQVDFEKGQVKVNAIAAKDAEGEKQAKEALAEQLKSILKEKDETTGKAILENQVQAPSSDKPITDADLDKVVEQIVNKAEKVEVKGSDGERRWEYRISLELMPDNIRKRVDIYKPMILKFCKQYVVDPKVVLAIIHTESFFNPKAYNRTGNAYGMMQIVPKYAGRTMNKKLYGKNSLPSSGTLFNPRYNLEMGIAFIAHLGNTHWKRVTNKTNQYYAIICNFNGGQGSVYKAFTGKLKKIPQEDWDKMFDDLNNLSNEEVYEILHKKAAWAETRHYIKKVRDRIDKYYKDIY
ncbi:MAG: murein transglycosylase domain-containing protein [Candidatus Cloacimonetes bacterium]|nr:murein transglycosylase domain-containing protein [Candidatus Cloacimonadota bacterium]